MAYKCKKISDFCFLCNVFNPLLRPTNSWNLGLTDVPLQELLQTMTINSIAPFILTSKLKHLLMKSPNKRKFVVNVSAMEGQFSRVTKVMVLLVVIMIGTYVYMKFGLFSNYVRSLRVVNVWEKRFKLQQLTHESFLTIDHSCKIFF